MTSKQGTFYRADTMAMLRCAGHSPEVIGIDPAGLDPNHSGAVIGIIRTTEFGGVEAVPIIKCLTGSPLVLSAGYPD